MLKIACEQFCKAGEADSQTRTKQKNTMMSNFLSNLLSMEAKVRLLTYWKDYTFDGVEYTPLMYKAIMRLAIIYLIATIQTLWDNLQILGVFAAMVSGDIDKINSEFDQNYSQIVVRGATVNNPLTSFLRPTPLSHATISRPIWKDGTTTMATDKAKMNFLKLKGKSGAKSPNDKKIVAVAAKISTLTA